MQHSTCEPVEHQQFRPWGGAVERILGPKPRRDTSERLGEVHRRDDRFAVACPKHSGSARNAARIVLPQEAARGQFVAANHLLARDDRHAFRGAKQLTCGTSTGRIAWRFPGYGAGASIHREQRIRVRRDTHQMGTDDRQTLFVPTRGKFGGRLAASGGLSARGRSIRDTCAAASDRTGIAGEPAQRARLLAHRHNQSGAKVRVQIASCGGQRGGRPGPSSLPWLASHATAPSRRAIFWSETHQIQRGTAEQRREQAVIAADDRPEERRVGVLVRRQEFLGAAAPPQFTRLAVVSRELVATGSPRPLAASGESGRGRRHLARFHREHRIVGDRHGMP